MGSFSEKPLVEELSEEPTSLISNGNQLEKVRELVPSTKFDFIRWDVNPFLEFLTEIFPQCLGYNTISGYRSGISANQDPINSPKHQHVSKSMTRIFNNTTLQLTFCIVDYAGKVFKFSNFNIL